MKMTETIRKKLNCESGAVQIVEATFVFPVMFLILFFLVYMGNAYYVKAQVESVVETYALQGAGYCADPVLEYMNQHDGKLPSLSSLDVEPYRYIFCGMDDIESQIGNSVAQEIGENTSIFFKNMSPNLKTPSAQIASFNNYVLYSTFSVEVTYTVTFPIKFMGAEAPPVLSICSRAEVAVNDTTEFIRNTDMAIDFISQTKIGQTISDIFGKVNDFISSFAS